MQARALLIPGILFDFGGGRVLTVPPLALGALELLQERLATAQALPATDPAVVATTIDAAHLALARNYPQITRDEVGELVDIGNMGEVYECLMDIGGVKRRTLQAQADTPGNAPAPAAQGTAGAASTPASLPTPAGPSSTSASS